MDGEYHHYYKLVGHEVIPCGDMESFSNRYGVTGADFYGLDLDRDPWRVARDEVGGSVISTVFLGLNHAWQSGPPMIFETMIFGGEHDEYQDRCSTWDEAVEMHKKAVELVKISIDRTKDGV